MTTNRGDRAIQRVLVLTGDPSLPDPTKRDGRYAEDDFEMYRQMRAALESLPGLDLDFLDAHDRLIERLAQDPPDLVVNFCDTGFRNVAAQEMHVPALLEMCGIPYTGCPPASMVLCYDKAIVRGIAHSLGIPVPHETYLAPDDDIDELDGPFPALIKPAQGDGSVGITPDAVVHDPEGASRYLRWFRDELPGRAALVQEYLPGAEYGMALVGNPDSEFVALPPLEVDYAELPAGLPPILAFESKTATDTPYSRVGVRRARLSEDAIETMRVRAALLFERLQCRDYARFDFRTGADGEIKLMEVNPNPAWGSDGKLALMAGFAGKSYPELLAMILDASRTRLATAR